MANINFLSDSHNVGHVGIGIEPTDDNMLIVKSVSDLINTEQIALFETDTSATNIRLKADNSANTDEASFDIQNQITPTVNEVMFNTDAEGVNTDRIREVQFGFGGSQRFTMRVTSDASGSNAYFGVNRNTPSSTIDAVSKATAANPGELFLRLSTSSTIETGVGSQIIFGVGSDATNNFNSSLIKGLRTSADDGSSSLSFFTTDRSQATTPAERVLIDADGAVTFNTIANATSDTNKFLVSDGGVLKYRTGAEVLSDIGAGTGSGTVTGVTAAAPITSTGGNAPEIGISNATGTTVGAAAIDAGTGISVSDSNGIYTVTNSSPDTGTPAILSNGSTPSLNTGITASEVRSLIGAGTGSGTITGSGTSGRIAYWNGGSSITSDADLLFNGSSVTIANPIFAADGTKANPSYSFTSDVDTGMFLNSVGELALNAAGDSKLRVSSSGVGVMDDIYHVSDTDTKIAFTTNAITVTSGGTDAFDVSSGATRFQTSTRFTSNATFDDNSKAKFGDNGTLEIYNNGTDSYIDDVSTGDLRIRSNFLKIEKYTGETMADFNDDNAVRLYYNNNQRWETLSDGAGTDGDIIETISNGGGKRIGFNVGDSFTHNGNTIAHYGISNADNSTDGGIVLSGYFGLKFATNGAIRATIQNDGDTALLSHTLVSGFEDSNGTTAYYYIPIAGSISEGTSNQYYRNFACPNSGRVVSIMMMHTSGSAVALTTATTQLRVIKNGSTAATSSELSASNGNNDGSYIEYAADVDFSKGDRLGFQFSKSSTSMRWAGTSATIIIELDDYNL